MEVEEARLHSSWNYHHPHGAETFVQSPVTVLCVDDEPAVLNSVTLGIRRWETYGVAVVSASAAFVVMWAVQGGTPTIPLYPFFMLAVIVSALSGGFRPGLLAVGLSVFYTVYFILRPRYLLLVGEWHALLSLIAFIGVGVSVSAIVSRLRRKQRALQASEAQLRTIVDSMTERLYVCDGSGRPLLANEAFLKYYRVAKAPVYPQSFVEGVETLDLDGNPVPLSDWPISRALRGAQVHGLELRVRSKRSGQEFINSYNAAPVLDSKGKVIMAVLTSEDVTVRKQAEQALIRSEKLAATGRLAATIAHEVNNPLAAALNTLYLARTDPTLTPETSNSLLVADQELRRAAHITQQTLGFYRESVNRTPVALPKLIDDVIEIYARKLKDRGITVDRRYKCGPCREGCEACFVANGGELRQIISNLLANGMDAIRDNGTLHIRVSRLSMLERSQPLIQLTMADNGCGIRAENLKRIFEPFYTTKEAVGTGLGLWITQELVRKHNGSIRVRSRKDKGTMFRITIPAMPVAIQAEQEEQKRVAGR